MPGDVWVKGRGGWGFQAEHVLGHKAKVQELDATVGHKAEMQGKGAESQQPSGLVVLIVEGQRSSEAQGTRSLEGVLVLLVKERGRSET